MSSLHRSGRLSHPEYLSQLPTEVCLEIVSNLNTVYDLGGLPRTCHKWNSLAGRKLYEANTAHDKGSCVRWAIEHKRMETVQRAIALEVDILRIEHLCLAAESGDLDMMKLILTRDHILRELLEPETVGGRATTPLLAAIASGNPDVVRFLLETGAKVDEKLEPPRYCNSKPLEVAVWLDLTDVISVLLEFGAEVLARILGIAVDKRYLDTALVLSKQKPPEQHPYGDIMEIAVKTRDSVFLDKVLKAGGDANSINKQGHSLLQLAVFSGYEPSYNILRAHGAQQGKHSSTWERTVLHEIKRHSPFAVEYWWTKKNTYRYFKYRNRLQYKTRATLRDESCPNSQDGAVRYGLIDAAELDRKDLDTTIHGLTRRHDAVGLRKAILLGGVDLNCRNDNGWTPLMVACLIDSPNMASILLQGGADPNCVINEESEGVNCFHIALYVGAGRDLLKLLMIAGVDYSDHRELYSKKGKKVLKSCIADFEYLRKRGLPSWSAQSIYNI